MEAMTMSAAINWDRWRADYHSMSFREHQDFNAMVAEAHPVQQQWHPDAVKRFLKERKPRRVVELGGWDGSLAASMLERFGFTESWVNYDITPGVPQTCEDERYQKVTLIDWPWNVRVTGDALVASHVFEHMKLDEARKVLETWDVDSVYVDVPIGSRQDWTGYEGTHIIDASADEFLEMADEAGFREVEAFDYGNAYRNGVAEPLGVIAFLERT